MNEKDRTASIIPGWYIEFLANALRQMPRPEELDQITAEGWSKNQKALKEALAKVLLPDRLVSDARFKLLSNFELTVPEDYKHESQLASFKKKHRKEFYGYNDNITDENFARVTNKLIPGETYEVKIFGISQPVSSEDCLALLKMQPRMMLVGAQGISLVRQLKKEEFPVGKWVISLDNKDALWKDAGGIHRVPIVLRYSDGDWHFDLGIFESFWRDVYCVLCFCDLPK